MGLGTLVIEKAIQALTFLKVSVDSSITSGADAVFPSVEVISDLAACSSVLTNTPQLKKAQHTITNFISKKCTQEKITREFEYNI